MTNTPTNSELALMINNIADGFAKHEKKIDRYIEAVEADRKEYRSGVERRLRSLENWKIAFVAKFSIYSAVALFLGSIIGSVMTNTILTWLAQ